MADKKSLLVEALGADGASVKELSENSFRIETTRPGKDGLPDDRIISEHRVWTDEEAAAAGYKGGVKTSDKKYKVFRTA